MSPYIGWLLDRLHEPSTWQGIVLILTSAGVISDPEQAAEIASAGAALFGAISVGRKESK
jgi:F0F1-type ATP synthase assembly protein I